MSIKRMLIGQRPFILLCVTILLSGCSFIRMQNTSQSPVRILVHVPDQDQGYTRTITPGETADAFSSYGGTYTVTTLPDDTYRELLTGVGRDLSRQLFTQRASLTPAEVAQLTAQIQDIGRQLDQLAAPGQGCEGHVPDLETIIVTISWDELNEAWVLVCP